MSKERRIFGRSQRSMLNHDLSRRRLLGAAAGAGGLALGASLAGRPRLARAQDGPSGNISYWHHFTSESEMTGLERALDSFAEQYPDIVVSQENIPNADYMAKFTTSAVAGGLPDTAMAAVDRIPDMVAMEGLIPLTDEITAWEGYDNIPENLWPAATQEDEIYGIPAFMFVNWLYYRQDWFEEAGIDSPPTTFEEFREVAIALTNPDEGRYGFGLRGGDGGQSFVVDIMRAYGALTEDDDGFAVIERDAAVEAVDFWASLFTVDQVVPPSAPNDSYRQIMEAFRTGQTGMVLHHTGSLAEISESLSEDQFMTALVPTGPELRVAGVSPLFNGMPRDDNAEASLAWLKHWGDTDVEIDFLEDTGYFPVSIAAANDERVQGNPIYGAAVDTLDIGVLPLAFPGYPGWASTVVLPAFQQVLTGQATAEQAVDDMIRGLDDV